MKTLEQQAKERVTDIVLQDVKRMYLMGVFDTWGGISGDEKCAVILATGDKAKALMEALAKMQEGVAA